MRGVILAVAMALMPALSAAQSSPQNLSALLQQSVGGQNPPSADFTPANAEAFVSQIFSAWSGPDASALNGMYAAEVDFYGSAIPVSKVQEANNRFAARWQTRQYSVSSFDIDQCVPATSTCTVTGTVHWDDHAPGPKLHSVGDASFSYTLEYQNGQFLISGEDGKVVDRNITPDDETPGVPSTDPNSPNYVPPSILNDNSNPDDQSSGSTPPQSQDSQSSDGTTATSPPTDPNNEGQTTAPTTGQESFWQSSGGLICLLLVIGAICIYFTPYLVATSRRSTNSTVVFFINLLLGWSILGWIVALFIACFSQTQTAREIEIETLRRLRGN